MGIPIFNTHTKKMFYFFPLNNIFIIDVIEQINVELIAFNNINSISNNILLPNIPIIVFLQY